MKTEPFYFAAIQRVCARAQVEIETHGGVGVPFTIAEKAVERAKALRLGPRVRRKKDSFEEGDQVWAVFDRDEHPRFADAVNLCNAHGVRVGRSNPCFELWLILHEQEYDKTDDRHKLQALLKDLRPEYDPDGAKTPDCDDMIAHVEVAEQRADAQLRRREDEDNRFGNPSTTVGELTAAIREASEAAR